MSSTDILNIVLVIGFLAVVVCMIFVTYHLIKTLKSITVLTDSLEETNQSIKEKIQMKALRLIPALVVGLVGKILKRGR